MKQDARRMFHGKGERGGIGVISRMGRGGSAGAVAWRGAAGIGQSLRAGVVTAGQSLGAGPGRGGQSRGAGGPSLRHLALCDKPLRNWRLGPCVNPTLYAGDVNQA